MSFVRYYYYPPFPDKETEAQGIKELLCSIDNIFAYQVQFNNSKKLSADLIGASLQAVLLLLSSTYREVGLKKQECKEQSQQHDRSSQTRLMKSVWERGS